jgi:1-acyl-sn-glycerol-3-phosphate acyltransferases
MMARIRSVLSILGIVVMTVSLGLVAIVAGIIGIRDRPGGVYDWVPRTWSKIILVIAGIKVTVHGRENAGAGDPRVFVSNHLSLFDIPCLSSVLPRNRFVAKAELFKIPIFGAAIRAAGMVEIQRENKRAAFDAYKVAGEKIRNGMSIVVFPEGTRGTEYPLSQFKKGPFILAIAAGVPIVPVITHGTREIVRKHEVTVRPGKVDIHFLEPVPTTGLKYEDRDKLTEAVRDRMIEAMRSLYGIESPPTRVRSSGSAEPEQALAAAAD